MTIKEKIEYYLEEISEKVSYLESLCDMAQASLEEKHPEMKEEESAGYPYLYGFVSSGCSGTARRIKAVIEELKNEMGWKE